MWQVGADVDLDDDNFRRRDRFNPYTEENDVDFFRRIRFTRPAFDALFDVLEPSLERFTRRHDALEPTMQLCTGLRYFAQGGYLRMVGDAHGLGDRATSNCVHTVARAICQNMNMFIRWPDAAEITETKYDFYTSEQWPSIVGLIDGTHVPIFTPFRPADEAVYVNRKGFHSINVQIVCNRQLKILNLDARFPGSTHDSYILRNSRVWQRFEDGEMPANSWLLGDSGYPVKPWLLTPFQATETAAEERYNTRHKQIRCAVERCNGVLKMRWRCLTKPMMFRPSRNSRIIAACGALHNYAIEQGMDLPEDAADFNDANLRVNVAAADRRAAPRDPEGALIRRVFANRHF